MVSYFKYQQVTEDEAIAEDGTIRDGHCIRVSMQDAQKARGDAALSDVERFVLEDKEYRESTKGSRPGFRTMPNDPKFRDGVDARNAAYTAYDRELTHAYLQRDDNWNANTATLSKLPKEGSACVTADKERGVFKLVNGNMVCVPSSKSNAEPEKALSDRALNDDREAAYAEYLDRVQSAYLRHR